MTPAPKRSTVDGSPLARLLSNPPELPVAKQLGEVAAALLGGAVVIELLFSRQGIGRLMLDSAVSKDVPLLLGITLLAAAIYVVVNFLVDLINHWVDPRTNAV